jgi:hypothetical protein
MPSHGHASHHHAAHHHAAIHHATTHHIGGGRRTGFISSSHPIHAVTRALFLTPEMIAHREKLQEINKAIDPPLSIKVLLRLAGLLHFVLFPLIIATVASPWYVIDGAGRRAWDGTTTTNVERQAGYLTLMEYQDCIRFSWSSSVDWDRCYFGDPILHSDAPETLKAPSRAAFALMMTLLITSFFGLFRHIRTCGMRTSRVGDEWLLKWTRWTRVQLSFIIVFVVIASSTYFAAVPDYVEDTIGPGNHHAGVAQALTDAIIALAVISMTLYSLYAFRIAAWAAAHPIPELPPMPEPPTPESVAARLGAEMARGMMMAQAGGLPVAAMAGPNGVVPYPPGGFPPGAFPPGAFPPGAFPPGAFPPGAFPPGAFPPGAFPPGAFPPGYGYPPGMFPPGMVGTGMGGMQQPPPPGVAPYNPGGGTPMGGPDDPSEGDGMKSPPAAYMPAASAQQQQQGGAGAPPGAAPYPSWAAPHTAGNPLPQGMFAYDPAPWLNLDTRIPVSNDGGAMSLRQAMEMTSAMANVLVPSTVQQPRNGVGRSGPDVDPDSNATAPRPQGPQEPGGGDGARAPPLGAIPRQSSAGDPSSEAPQL